MLFKESVKNIIEFTIAYLIDKMILKFLQNWLITHILKSDKQYTEFFLEIQKKAKKQGGWFAFLKN